MDRHYKYIKTGLFETPENYTYSEANGCDFIKKWCKSRDSFVAALEHDIKFDSDIFCDDKPIKNLEYFVTNDILNNLFFKFDETLLFRFIKKYENSKKIYRFYNLDWGPIKSSGHTNLNLYIKLSFLLLQYFESKNIIQALNCCLKINDLLISYQSSLDIKQRNNVAFLLRTEFDYIDSIWKVR